MSSQPAAEIPGLTYVGQLKVQVAAPVDLGIAQDGRRRMVAILGGTLEGEIGSGEVLPGGADWQTLHDDGSVSVDAQYAIRLARGDVMTIRSTGVRTESPDGSAVYFRTGMTFSAAVTRPELNRHLFVSSGSRDGSIVSLDLYRVD